MKTLVFSILMILAAFEIYAQNYRINFAGTGASTTVDSVNVENLSQCTSLTLAGTDTLNLNATTGINEFHHAETGVTIYPNPSPGYCSVEFEATSAINVSIGLYNMYGKEVLQQTEFIQKGKHLFHLCGIQVGVYILKVESDQSLYAAKLVSNATETSCPVIKYNGLTGGINERPWYSRTKEMKGSGSTGSIVNMQFNAGDTLKLTGKSGIYRTVKMLFPDQSQTVTFYFVNCSDADSNHYAVVQIGSQLWMQENLKTTKYRDGSDIPNVPDSATWGNLTTGAWCDYHNLPAEGEQYGHLYNFYAVADSRNMCPIGWHVASHSEWNILEKFLDSTVDTTALGGTGNVIGRILKEGCNTRWEYMDTTYGINSAGFTALCTNYRTASGSWSLAPDNNHDDSFWTATSYNTNSAWYRSLRWCYSDIYGLFPMKKAGQSVRCIKDN
ncbi:MAG: T9SS type A sorting domain-containing protein [Bacteroidetes bacterium]|nr:T9SS type A sorting domain-containing protein [Bacteroidota bacterium]